jgi:hypothetical protein
VLKQLQHRHGMTLLRFQLGGGAFFFFLRGQEHQPPEANLAAPATATAHASASPDMRLFADAAQSVRARGGAAWTASAGLPSYQNTPDTPAARGRPRRRGPWLAVCIGATVVIALLSVFGLTLTGDDEFNNKPVLSVYVWGAAGVRCGHLAALPTWHV